MTPLAHWHIEADKGPLSAECVDRGIISFQSLLEWVDQLPYCRNRDRANFYSVLVEECGACSTKHALVKSIADENGWSGVQLVLGQYKMSELTNPGLGEILRRHKVDFIPEAHVFLKIGGKIIDITGLPKGINSFELTLKDEHLIEPEQIGDYKLKWHHAILTKFCETVNKSVEEVKNIRENCLQSLYQI